MGTHARKQERARERERDDGVVTAVVDVTRSFHQYGQLLYLSSKNKNEGEEEEDPTSSCRAPLASFKNHMLFLSLLGQCSRVNCERTSPLNTFFLPPPL